MDEILSQARVLHSRTTNWVQFYRLVFGVDGLIRSTLEGDDLLRYFATDDYRELCELLADLRSTDSAKQSAVEPCQVITIRIPCSLHRVLADECRETDLSLNQLAITKLLSRCDSRCTPEPVGQRRGRRLCDR